MEELKQKFTVTMEDLNGIPELSTIEKAEFIKVMSMILTILDNRRRCYKNTFTELRTVFPDTAIHEIYKKVMRLKEGYKQGVVFTDSFIDIAGYCILELMELLREEKGENNMDKQTIQQTNEQREKIYKMMINEYHQATNEGTSVCLNEVAVGRTPLIKSNEE